jgi:aminoglycoside phosphotransferase family enzyme/predicted kinase
MNIDQAKAPNHGSDHNAVVTWLANPASYADGSHRVDVVETHISQVFLTERFVYKLKKPVRFDFLDFSTLEKREHACREELRLNRRMAAEIYLDVVPILRDRAGRFTFGGAGEVVDWVVKMRRLPAERMFDDLIRSHRLTDLDVRKTADYFADFYAATTPLVVRPQDYHRTLVDNVEDNFSALLAADGVSADQIRRIHTFQLRLLKCRSELFHARVLDGRIIDGHGDLRPEHVCLLDPPAVFDCIEFNEALRHIDVLDELCFLAMECDALEADSVGEHILKTCLERSQDRPPAELTAFYKSYRACVRAKVALLRSTQLSGDERETQRRAGERYLQLAERYLRESGVRPFVIVVSGLMGSGKSTLAGALAAELGAEIIRTDEVRNELFPARVDAEAFGDGKYSSEGRERVYEEVLRRATERLSSGVPVVLDGTFTSAAARMRALQAGRELNADAFTVRCVCPREVAIERIGARLLQTVPDASEARPELYDRQAALWEIGGDEESTCDVDTTSSIAEQLETAFEALA